MQSVENTRRELFEKAFAHMDLTKVDSEYSWKIVESRWEGFNAALDSVVIELPQPISKFNTNSDGYINPVAVEYDECIQDCKDAIESTNLGIKIK